MAVADRQVTAPIEHPGEERSNEVRRRLSECEPRSLRTFTPSMAVVARSQGSYHWTPEGRKLADFTSGVLVANLGHNPPRWWQRVLTYLGANLQAKEPFATAVTLNAYNACTEVEMQACQRLLDTLRAEPGGARCEQVLWAASGSEAIQKALWTAMARRPGADIILATRFGFHGKKGLANAVTGTEQDPERDPRVKFISFPREECQNLEARQKQLDLRKYRAELDALWKEHGNKICCLITEPYLGGGGSYHPQPAYTQMLQQFCREHDIIFIFDEVQSNFGRTGSLFAFTDYGIEPDIVVLGKGLGNGVPVSAAVGRADLFDALNYGQGSDTWSANPLASAAVLATLDEFASGEVLAGARELSAVLRAGLTKLTQTGAVAHVRGEGMVWGIECQAVGSMSAGEVARACVAACYLGDAQGRAIHLLGPLADKVIRVSPPLVMPLAEAREYLEVLYERFAEVARQAR
ncbi:MAG: aspartate aminotransferase family protein [Planctomycetes bacterium]|nr:aspartate aminotransferase family protein [Planctomycetota bacterium]